MSPNTAALLRAASDLARDLGVSSPIKILIVDDALDFCWLLRQMMVEMSGVDYVVDIETDPDKAKVIMAAQDHDLYIIDQNLGGGIAGLDLVDALQREGWHLPFIMVTGSDNHDRDAMGQDCMAYCLKNDLTDATTLDRIIRYALKNFWTRECASYCSHEESKSAALPPPQAVRLVAERVSLGTGGTPAH